MGFGRRWKLVKTVKKVNFWYQSHIVTRAGRAYGEGNIVSKARAVRRMQQTTMDNLIIVKPASANPRVMHDIFRQITRQTSGIYGQDFVIYDCSDFNPTERELQRWMQVQAFGLRGSISDPSTFTILVGAGEAVAYIVEAFEQAAYGSIIVGWYDNMNDAIAHVQNGRRIFSSW